MPGGPGAPHAQRYSENSEYYEGDGKPTTLSGQVKFLLKRIKKAHSTKPRKPLKIRYKGKKKKGNPKAMHKKRKKGY